MLKPRAIVIGAGFGGIAAAIRLQAAGIKTTLLEKREKPGGRAYVFEHEGHTFDMGPTVITAPHVLDELFEVAGKRTEDFVQLLPVAPFYRLCWEDGYRFDYGPDEKELLAQIHMKSPRDVEGYKKFYSYTQKVFQAGYQELVHVPFLDWQSMARVAPQLIKLRAYRSVYQAVSRYIQDPRLREALSFHSLLIGGNPFSAPAIYVLIHALEKKWGVYCVKGGTHVLIDKLLDLFQALGGTLHCGAEVEKILVESGEVTGVKTTAGDLFGAEFVVSNADVTHTYKKLLRSEKSLQKQRRRLDRMRYSQALFLIYFATDKRYENVAHHSILFGGDYRKTLDAIFNKGELPEQNSYYLHAPCRSDESLAPPGKDSFYVLANVPNLKSKKIDWQVYSEIYEEQILNYLEKHYLPDLGRHLTFKKCYTPLNFEKDLNAQWGTAFSLEPTLLQSAYFRIHNRDENIKGLYFVGAGTHPGAGIPGVINSAKATVRVLLRDLGLEPRVERGFAYAT